MLLNLQRLTFLKVNTVSFLLEEAIVQIMTLPLTLTVASGVECQTKMRDYVLVRNWIRDPLTPHQHLTGQTHLPFQCLLKDRRRINETITKQGFKFLFSFCILTPIVKMLVLPEWQLTNKGKKIPRLKKRKKCIQYLETRKNVLPQILPGSQSTFSAHFLFLWWHSSPRKCFWNQLYF